MLLGFVLVTVGPSAAALAPPQDLRGEIEPGGARALAYSPTGDLWLGTRDGELFVCRDGETWSEVEAGTRKPGPGEFETDELEHIRFFDAEHALVAGQVGTDEEARIFRTADGGATWTPVSLPQALRVDDAQAMPDGHAWLVGSSGALLASRDFGATWEVAGTPFDFLQRSGSVCFETPEHGLVSSFGNALKETFDGGRTWRELATPFEPTRRYRRDDPEVVWEVEDIALLGNAWVVRQDHGLHARARSGEAPWKTIDFEGHAVVAARPMGDALVVVTDDQRVWRVSATLERTLACAEPLEASPWRLATGPREAAFLTDVRGRICRLADGRLACSSMLTPSAGPWNLDSYDRAASGELLGITHSGLYRSRDLEKGWERLAEGLAFREVRSSADGSHAFVAGYTGFWIWRALDGELRPIRLAEVPLEEFVVAARRSDLWLATAFEAASDRQTQRLLNTTDVTRVGPGFRALVLASKDEGLSWETIDEYRGAIPHAAWFGDGGALHVYMSDGAILGGSVDGTGKIVEGELEKLATLEGIGGQCGQWLAFPEPRLGWAGSHGYFGGARLDRSLDGGRTWSPVVPAPEEYTEVYRLGGGGCARVLGFLDLGRVELWRDGEFRELRRFDAAVDDAHVDAGGALLVRLESEEVWSLSADAQSWTRLGKIAIPAR